MNKEILFEERERLSKELKILDNQYNKELSEVKDKHIHKINDRIEKIEDIRFKLYRLGVPPEDC